MVKVTSLGLFILDSFEYKSGINEAETVDENIVLPIKRDTEIGGGGLYAILGSRIWLPPTEIGLLIDRGEDWDYDKIQSSLDRFGSMWLYRNKIGPTTRALNSYTGNHREFQYLTPRTRLEPVDLPPSLLTTEWMHFVCSPTRAIMILFQLSASFNPQLCFEPIPDKCIPEELGALIEVLPHLAIFSPNHEEALTLLGRENEFNDRMEIEERKKVIESVAEKFIELGVEKGLVVIRSGADGSYSKRKNCKGFWTDAYHTDARRVIDVTGAGNSFMGGLMAGFVETPKDDKLACMKASVSASYFIEQFGIPFISISTETEKELWNGTSPQERLVELEKRMDKGDFGIEALSCN